MFGVRFRLALGATILAAAAGLVAIASERPLYLIVAGVLALIPVGYGTAALIRPAPALPRSITAVGVVAILVLATSSFFGLRSCQNRLGAGADLSSCDLAAADLGGLDLRGADLSDADLTGADLRRTNLSGADLSGANLLGARVEGIALEDATLAGADLSGLELTGVVLPESDLSGADLSGARLDDAELAGADLSGARLTDASLVVANLRGANLDGAILQGAVLDGADLTQAQLVGADLSGASLLRALLDDADLTQADLSGAALDGVSLTGVSAVDADLTGANLRRATLDDADLTQADLSGAILQGAHLQRVDLTGASLDGAQLSDARLDRAVLSGATLAGADLAGVSLVGATGYTDDVLASALGVTGDALARTLAVQRIRIEARDDVIAALGASCRGRPVGPAAGFPSGDLHPAVLLTETGAVSPFAGDVPTIWEPVAVRFAQLVACIEEDRQVVQVCGGYIDLTTGAPAPGITRLRLTVAVRLVEARTGRLVEERVFQGGEPRLCQLTESIDTTTITGPPVRFAQLRGFLAGHVE